MPKKIRTNHHDHLTSPVIKLGLQPDETEAWREQGRCWGRTTSPETDYWYPEQEEPEAVRKAKTATAKAVCYGCPVKEECLRYAIEAPESFGVWGGKTARERSVIRRQWEQDGLL